VVQKIDKIDSLDALSTKKKKVAHPSPLSQLMGIKECLLHYIFELSKQGLTINSFVIVLRAISQLKSARRASQRNAAL
jgi:hypothetical protein